MKNKLSIFLAKNFLGSQVGWHLSVICIISNLPIWIILIKLNFFNEILCFSWFVLSCSIAIFFMYLLLEFNTIKEKSEFKDTNIGIIDIREKIPKRVRIVKRFSIDEIKHHGEIIEKEINKEFSDYIMKNYHKIHKEQNGDYIELSKEFLILDQTI